ncbi:MAG: hypothetical protein UV82_C0012G0028 [Candidatus Magasanikbacteria bacterium GW2011_GWD2_43_18]|uniref:TrbC/VIRB2 family protein n=1 Tax=Candidatus Magasanikbacteria bacterium GW2011_GWE2_42_7 TaxID=1619052 RepID=A0A0G1BHX0_9BACT|nr:MAG: hypothetical protein UV18_C0005G0115 [Candidatus Magasanikbacteria bacterium GW2011_GWC2_42_27]KKS72789.1 MAG: hypothetical protein UV42_C0004G0001 [Candidatus Magasanikbacteria bacterium GW2011_GWE2_42_7]KKT04043.1 MAG: hypothetical protein UV82_C0012G0028 [Candidatus Magasanikbacteria bacterium GW2011_GWD2_43_18]KKT25949.1 MAG: hypothetical protein UW10_C0003G0110 [Candidatus Magasanikbacteria bacterium GW2011_GWA2_43_9]HBB37924.1 hypothetical protein [Candidatus Magasanikbacteria bac
MKRTFLAISLILVGSLGLLQSVPAFASNPSLSNDPLGVNYGSYTGLSDQDVRVSIARVIQFVLGFLGLIFLVLVIFAGFLWMTSAGNEDRVEKAKKILWGAVIGVAIILASYGITEFVVKNFYEVTTNSPYNAP